MQETKQQEASKSEPTLDQLKAQLRQAIDDGNDAEVVRLSKSVQKYSTDIVKAEVEKQKKEAEALAGDREKLAAKIHQMLGGVPDLKKDLDRVKAKGYTFKLDEPDMQYKSVALTVPTIRKAGGGGGGATGALKDQTGMRRSELVDKFATDVEKAGIQKAQEDASTRPDSARYQAEKPIIKRILADHPELIKK